MDQIKTLLEQLGDISDDDLTSLQASIISEFEKVEAEDPTPQSVDAMTELANSLDSVRSEAQRREAQMAELTARAAEAATRVHGATADGEKDNTGTDGASEVDPSTDSTDPTDPAGDVPDGTDPADLPVVPDVPTDPVSDPAAPPLPTDTEDVTEAPETPGEIPDAEDVMEGGEPAAGDPAQPAVDPTLDPNADPNADSTGEADPNKKKNTPPVFSASSDEGSATELSTSETATADVTPTPEAEASNTNNSAPVAQEEAQTVTAAAEGTGFSAPADRRPDVAQAKAPAVIVAGADIPGLSVGSKLNNMTEVAEAMTKRLGSLRNINGGDGEQHSVATFATEYPEDRVLTNDFNGNKKKIENVVSRDAVVASGGFFNVPLQPSYDINVIGTDARPVRDILPRFQADRGGIRFLQPPTLQSYAPAVGIWTEQNDIDAEQVYTNGATGPLKNVLLVGSVQEKTAYIDAVTLQLQFGNLATRVFPELIAVHNELALVQHARQAEAHLLQKMIAQSTAVTTNSTVGFARDFLVQIKAAAAAYRSRYRLDGNINLRAIVPGWVFDAMAADLTLQMPGDDTLGISRQTIEGYLRGSGVTISESLDMGVFGTQQTGALSQFPTQFDWLLFAEGTFLFLDGGTLDLGIIRDSGLVGTNDYRMFTETFEGVAKVGIESLVITSTIALTGAAGALVTIPRPAAAANADVTPQPLANNG